MLVWMLDVVVHSRNANESMHCALSYQLVDRDNVFHNDIALR